MSRSATVVGPELPSTISSITYGIRFNFGRRVQTGGEVRLAASGWDHDNTVPVVPTDISHCNFRGATFKQTDESMHDGPKPFTETEVKH